MQQSPTAAETKPRAGHTPGPWFTRDNGIYWEITTEDSDCAPGIGNTCSSKYLEGGDKGEANARLIAAAPDLLDALVMVRDADEDCKLDGLPTIPAPARAKIDAAIAKAEGRS